MTGRPTTIVLVDDEPLLVEALTSQIRLQSDIVVHSTTSPAEVVDLVVRHDPHVVVSDVRMPELSGIDVVGAVRRVRTNLPFVLMTAFSVTEVRAQTSVMPSLSFLQKPFEVSQLIELVDSLRSRSDDGRFSGVVAIESLTDVVQLYVLSNTCGLLEVRRREKVGRIWIDRGAILHAEHDEQQGTDALFDILSWKGGSFALSMGVRAPTRTIFETATTLMLESCRRQDEATAMRTPQDTSTRSGWSWHPAPGDSIDSAWDTNLFSDDAPSIQAGPPIQQSRSRDDHR
jgi:DNA-binding response OmpR family regulator